MEDAYLDALGERTIKKQQELIIKISNLMRENETGGDAIFEAHFSAGMNSFQIYDRELFDKVASGAEIERTENQHSGTWCYEAERDGIKFVHLSDEAVENEA